MKRLYQYIEIPGKNLQREGHDRDKSKFWDGGKWDNFINPLLPEGCEDLPFLEIGSNSGMFLKKAEDKGFRHVFGVERQEDRIKTAEWYKESVKGKFNVINQSMNASFDWSQLPRLGVTLISNTHYYMGINDFAETINSLRNRTVYCIVVSADGRKISGRVGHSIEEVRLFFNDWTEVGVINNISTENDPSPREGMYGIVFKSNLELYDIDTWWNDWPRKCERIKKFKYNALFPATEDFYSKIVSLAPGEDFDIKSTKLYEYYSLRKSPERAFELLKYKKELAEDIKKNGIKDLIYFSSDYRLKDGISRLSIARALGYKKIIIKKL